MRGVVVVLACAVTAVAAQPVENGRFFKRDGVSIYYDVRGAGPGTPLVLVNGGPGFDHAYFHVSTV